jgi:hypothetical protein
VRPFTPDAGEDFRSLWERQQHPPSVQKLAKPNALMFFHIPLCVLINITLFSVQLTPLIQICSQESYNVADTDPRTGQALDVGTSGLEKQGSAKKSDGFFEKGLLRAFETQHRGAGGIPEVKVVGNGHCHGKGHSSCACSARSSY